MKYEKEEMGWCAPLPVTKWGSVLLGVSLERLFRGGKLSLIDISLLGLTIEISGEMRGSSE